MKFKFTVLRAGLFVIFASLVVWVGSLMYQDMTYEQIFAGRDSRTDEGIQYTSVDEEVALIEMASERDFIVRCDGKLLEREEYLVSPVGTGVKYHLEASCEVLTIEKGSPVIRSTANMRGVATDSASIWTLVIFFTIVFWFVIFLVCFYL